MMFVRALIGVAAIVGAVCVLAPASAETAHTISLQPGRNVVTWNGAEPYPIADFAGTPVTQIHRWDAVSQEWLSRIVGQDGGTLPELHLLPRVQYMLVADAQHEIDVANPLAGINPRAELRRDGRPDDPLRFEAYWPNEDSPLEDLVVLRGEHERLSVRAETAGGRGDVGFWWVIDGRVNHAGLASDDVDLMPGAHDDGRLFAVDSMGQVTMVELPRIVRLPQVEIPEMVYGVNAWAMSAPIGWHYGNQYMSRDEYLAVIEKITEIGFEYVRLFVPMNLVLFSSGISPYVDHLDWLVRQVHNAGLEPMPIVGPMGTQWAQSADISVDRDILHAGWETGDVNHTEAFARTAARRWPQVTFWDVSNEPNIKQYRADLDPVLEVQQQRAAAFGILYENPNAIIIGGTPCCYWVDGQTKWEWGIHGLVFLEAMYEAGFGPWHDILGIHLSVDLDDFDYEVDWARRLMAGYGDNTKPLWATETPADWRSDEQYTELLMSHLQRATERDDLNGVLIWKIRDSFDQGSLTHSTEHESGIIEPEYRDGRLTLQPAGVAIRDFLRALRETQAAGSD